MLKLIIIYNAKEQWIQQINLLRKDQQINSSINVQKNFKTFTLRHPKLLQISQLGNFYSKWRLYSRQETSYHPINYEIHVFGDNLSGGQPLIIAQHHQSSIHYSRSQKEASYIITWHRFICHVQMTRWKTCPSFSSFFFCRGGKGKKKNGPGDDSVAC